MSPAYLLAPSQISSDSTLLNAIHGISQRVIRIGNFQTTVSTRVSGAYVPYVEHMHWAFGMCRVVHERTGVFV